MLKASGEFDESEGRDGEEEKADSLVRESGKRDEVGLGEEEGGSAENVGEEAEGEGRE